MYVFTNLYPSTIPTNLQCCELSLNPSLVLNESQHWPILYILYFICLLFLSRPLQILFVFVHLKLLQTSLFLQSLRSIEVCCICICFVPHFLFNPLRKVKRIPYCLLHPSSGARSSCDSAPWDIKRHLGPLIVAQTCNWVVKYPIVCWSHLIPFGVPPIAN